jgi:hypothetical protein
MTRFDKSMFSIVAATVLRQDTNIILSPMSDASSKADANNRNFDRLCLDQHDDRMSVEGMVDAMAAALLRMSLSEERERTALKYISQHLDNLPPEKSVDAAFSTLKHVQYSLWAMAHARDAVTPEMRNARRELERDKLSDFTHQMDRLARHNPLLWETHKENAIKELVPLSLLVNQVQTLTMPPVDDDEEDFLVRHDVTLKRREPELVVA